MSKILSLYGFGGKKDIKFMGVSKNRQSKKVGNYFLSEH
jgi:hypothetical protein